MLANRKRLAAQYAKVNATAAARIHQNDKTYRVAVSKDPVGYELRSGRRPRRITSGLAACT